jgi:methionyl aminopeptidase
MNNNNILKDALQGAKVHKNVSKKVYEYVKPGVTIKEIINFIENGVREETKYNNLEPLKCGIGFPIGIGINNCVAHYTLNYEDYILESGNNNKILDKNDIIKIDYGVHYNGMIIDSAFTLCFDEKYNEFINLSKETTDFAIKQCGVDAILGEIGESIEEFIKSHELNIDGKNYDINVMKELSGHMIKPFEIHAGKAVPNIKINYPLRMNENEFYAVEPFITTGKGVSILKEPKSHYMINKEYININTKLKKEDDYILSLIKNNYSSMPFCQKWLCEVVCSINNKNQNENDYNITQILNKLEYKNIIKSYPPIYDIEGSIVGQHEHTIYITDKGVLNMSKNKNY